MTLQTRIDRLQTGSAKVGCLLNPMGGQTRKRGPAIRQALDEIPAIIVCEATDANTFKTAINQLIQADIDLLVIIAEMAITHAILSHLFTALPLTDWPILMIIPGGTTNMTALDIGIQDKPEQALQRLRDYLSKQAAPRLVQRSALRIEQTGTDSIYGMFFAVGLVARGVKFSRSPVKQLGITGGIFYLYDYVPFIGRHAGWHGAGSSPSEWAPVRMIMTEENGQTSGHLCVCTGQ